MTSTTPILVTGAHRSGTTWVGETLGRARRTVVLHEPFNRDIRPSWLVPQPPQQYFYATPDNVGGLDPGLQRLLQLRYPLRQQWSRSTPRRTAAAMIQRYAAGLGGRLRSARVVLKDPLALLAAPWLAERFGIQVVILVRHPAAFASSLRRLDWRFDFSELARQNALMDGPLAEHAQEIAAAVARPPDILEQAALLWKVLYGVVDIWRAQHPHFVVRRYEDLARAPTAGFIDLYRQLDLSWDNSVATQVDRLTSRQNPAELPPDAYRHTRRDSAAMTDVWRSRLSSAEVALIRRDVGATAERYYSAAEW